MVPITVIGVGPNNIAPNPTPVGCEQDPVTDGILMQIVQIQIHLLNLKHLLILTFP